MEGQTTCPVCKLFLLPGMCLDEHLETHPKDQVIKALVSMYSSPAAARSQPPTTPVNTVTTLTPQIYGTPTNGGTIFLNASNGNYPQTPKYILIPQSKTTQLALPPPPLRLNSNNNSSFTHQQLPQQQQQHYQSQPQTTHMTIPTLTATNSQIPIVTAPHGASDVIGNQHTIQYLQETDKNVMIVNSCSTQYIQQTTIPNSTNNNNNESSSATSVAAAVPPIFPRYTNERYSGPPPPYSTAISTITQTQNHTMRSRLHQQSATVMRQSLLKHEDDLQHHHEEGEVVLHEFVVPSMDSSNEVEYVGQEDEDEEVENPSVVYEESNLNSQDMEIDSMTYDERYGDEYESEHQIDVKDEVMDEQQLQQPSGMTLDCERGNENSNAAIVDYLKDKDNLSPSEKRQPLNESIPKPNKTTSLSTANDKAMKCGFEASFKSSAKHGLKVISNIKVTEDILSEGLKDIIIRANSKTSGSTDDIFIQTGSCKFPMPLIERIIKTEAKCSTHDEPTMSAPTPEVQKVMEVVEIVDVEETVPEIKMKKEREDIVETSIEDMPIVMAEDVAEEETKGHTSVIRLVSTTGEHIPPTHVVSQPPSPVPSTSKDLPAIFEAPAPPPPAVTSSVTTNSNAPIPLYRCTLSSMTRPVFNKPPKKLFVKFKNPPPTMEIEETVQKIKQEPAHEESLVVEMKKPIENKGIVRLQEPNLESIDDSNLESIITLSPASAKAEIESDSDEQPNEEIIVKQEPDLDHNELIEEPIDEEMPEQDEENDDHLTSSQSSSSSAIYHSNINTEEIFKEIQENYPSFSKDILNDRNFAQDFIKKELVVKEEIVDVGNEEEVVDHDENEGNEEIILPMEENGLVAVGDDEEANDMKQTGNDLNETKPLKPEEYELLDKRVELGSTSDEVSRRTHKLENGIVVEEENSRMSVHGRDGVGFFNHTKSDLNEAGPSRCTATSTSPANNHQHTEMSAVAPRESFALSNFFSYANTDPDADHYMYTNERARFSPMVYNPTSEENNQFQWCQSPQYPPFDERSSYVDLDLCSKTNSNSISVSATTTTTTQHTIDNNSAHTNVTTNDRAPSAHSLNIRTDEKMPAKGELSEQESNGEMEQWNQNDKNCFQIYPLSENTLPHYPSSYEMSTAQECWNLNTKCTTVTSANHMQHNGHNLIVSNFQIINSNPDQLLHNPHENSPHLSLASGLQEIIPKLEHGIPSATATSSSGDSKKILADKIKSRKYRCNECPEVFPLLKLRREHMAHDHGHQHTHEQNNSLLCTTKIKKESGLLLSSVASSSSAPHTVISQDIFSDLAHTQQFIIKQIKDATTTELEEQTSVTKYKTKINRILMDYNMLTHELQLHTTDSTVSQEAKLEILRRNLNTLGMSMMYTCITCRAEFLTLRLFDEHMNVHPGECYTCGRTFKHWSNFALHIKRHLGIRNYVCRACHKGFVVRQKLIEHLRTHTGHAPIKCNLCNERFRRYSNLVQHRNRHHLNKRPPKADFVCHCGEVFNSKAKVEWHAEIHEAKPKGCPHCRERFIHRNSLTRHIRLSHPEKYDFVKKDTHTCPICLKKFVASSIKTHMETHSASKKLYSCNICNKNFSTKWNLKQHQYTHANRSSKPFLCTLCPNAFIRETDFVTHMNAHRCIRPYTCNFCGRQFVRKYNWLRHTREHEKEKKFACTTCGKKFHRQYYLTEHKRVHSGERPFSCNICGKTSATKTNHNKHVKIHHARDPLTAEG